MNNPTQQEIAEFEMPAPVAGTAVAFYPNGQKESKCDQLGHVVAVHRTGRSAKIRLTNGMVRDGVRHVDDPKLRMNVEQRQNGAWDYSPEYIRQQEYIESLEKRIEHLEAVVGVIREPDPLPAPPASGSEVEIAPDVSVVLDRDALKAMAKTLGLDFQPNIPTEKLRKLIEDATAVAG